MARADGTATAVGGDLIATRLESAREHQVVMVAGLDGHINGTTPTWIVSTGNVVNVAAARTTRLDVFNAAGSGIILEVHALLIIPTLIAVTGVGMTWELIRTIAVGTGGTALTARAYDTTNPALPAGVTARSSPTGGATGTDVLQFVNTSSEETIPYASMASVLNHLLNGPRLQPLVLREGQGLKVDQTTNSSVGSTNIAVIFTIG